MTGPSTLRAMVCAALLVATGCSSDGTAAPAPPPPSATYGIGADPVSAAEIEDGCPAPSRRTAFPPDGVLPPDPVAFRLCNALEQGGRGRQFDLDVRPELLRSGASDLADDINQLAPALRDQGGDGFCNADLGSDLLIWFAYADGEAFAVRYQRHGCRDVIVDASTRRGADRRLETTVTTLLDTSDQVASGETMRTVKS
ncbi:MAG: hypothetical protein F2667_04810 [Actinobacteria bacterium]|uniref:Unannotated protein n=1 Tax=freshwater metagenome TaxID=449393 RepID=A0A6J6PLD6_9ZZZZ|nr:hypothetical protein [Actinomycetota bacterium]